MADINTEELLSEERIGILELSRRLKVTPKTIRRWLEKGVLPNQYRLGTMSFWTESQISHWLSQQELATRHDDQPYSK